MTFDRAFFITTVTWQRTPLFRNLQRSELMMDVLVHYREQKKYIVHEFVIMPDHLHLLLTPAADLSLERSAADQRRILLSIGQIEKRPSLAGELHEPSRSRRAGL